MEDKSVKLRIMDNILDKINSNYNLTLFEKDFMDNFHIISEDDVKDYLRMSKYTTINKIESLLIKKRVVICNLYDEYGKIGEDIISLNNDTIIFKKTAPFKIRDNGLYNLIYIVKNNKYSLEMHDEYYEELFV